MSSAPFAGLTVVEAANYLAGPLAGMTMADLGADVIKVEPPRGDPYRRLGRSYGDGSLVFKAANQNKRNVVLDLKSEAGLAELKGLLSTADVFLTNWRPDVAERMGLTAELVREEFPQLIWARVSGYGQHGPRAELPAYDGIIQARSGIAVSGGTDPLNTNSNVADKVSAMFAAQTIMAALYQRTRTGTGSICDVAMVDAMAYFYAADVAAGHRIADAEPDLAVGRAALGNPTFKAADGWVTLSPVSGRQVRSAMEAAGCGDRFGEVMSADRSETFDVFADIIEPHLLTRSAAEWEDAFIAADVPAAAVRDFSQHLTDSQTVHNRIYERVDDPSVDGDWLLVRFPGLFDGEPAETAKLAAPSLPSSPDGDRDPDG